VQYGTLSNGKCSNPKQVGERRLQIIHKVGLCGYGNNTSFS
jgi:hypothetical protein